MSEYTPGPWVVEPPIDKKSSWTVTLPAYALSPGPVYVYRLWLGRYPNDKANAYLIAAAPDLLEAARAIREAFRSGGGMFGAQDMVEAAIAKAEGKTA